MAGIYLGGAALGSPITLYESGRPGDLMQGASPIGRKSDPYSSASPIASAGTWLTRLDNARGLYAPDGIFASDPSAIVLYAAVGSSLVFVGTADSISLAAGTAALRAEVRWRDVVEAWLSQPMPTVPTGSQDESVVIHAQAPLAGTLEGLGVTVPMGFPAIDVWLPSRATNIRTWLFPALGALGYQVDWSATFEATAKTITNPAIVLIPEATFRNSTLTRFEDDRLLVPGGPRIDDGRRQVVNAWAGRFSYVEGAERREEDINIFESTNGLHENPILTSPIQRSREQWGLRRARWELPFVRRDQLVDAVGAAVGARYWPHYRYEVTLEGASAAGLRIGDGLIIDSDLGTDEGRGLSVVGRVISTTIDLETETARVLFEERDGRDPDYRAWAAAGAASAPAS